MIIIYDYYWIAEKSRACNRQLMPSVLKFHLIKLSKVRNESMISFSVSRNHHHELIIISKCDILSRKIN